MSNVSELMQQRQTASNQSHTKYQIKDISSQSVQTPIQLLNDQKSNSPDEFIEDFNLSSDKKPSDFKSVLSSKYQQVTSTYKIEKNYINIATAMSIYDLSQRQQQAQNIKRKQYQTKHSRIQKVPSQKIIKQSYSQSNLKTVVAEEEKSFEKHHALEKHIFTRVKKMNYKPKGGLKHGKEDSFGKQLLIIIFDGILGYIEQNNCLQIYKLYLRPGAVSFLLQLSEIFDLCLVFPQSYKLLHINAFLVCLQKFEVYFHSVYKERSQVKCFYKDVYCFDKIFKDYQKINSDFQVKDALILGAINYEVERNIIKENLIEDKVSTMKCLNISRKGIEENPLIIMMQHMRLDTEESDSSVSLIYLGQSLGYLFAKKADYSIQLKAFNIKLVPLQQQHIRNNSHSDYPSSNFGLTDQNKQIFTRIGNHPIHGLRALKITNNKQQFMRDINFFESKQQVKFTEGQRKLGSFIGLDMASMEVYNQLKFTNQSIQVSRMQYNPKTPILILNESEVIIGSSPLLPPKAAGSRRECECCKNKKRGGNQDDIDKENMKVCKIISERYESDMSHRVIIFPQYLYSPISNTLVDQFQMSQGSIDVINIIYSKQQQQPPS